MAGGFWNTIEDLESAFIPLGVQRPCVNLRCAVERVKSRIDFEHALLPKLCAVASDAAPRMQGEATVIISEPARLLACCFLGKIQNAATRFIARLFSGPPEEKKAAHLVALLEYLAEYADDRSTELKFQFEYAPAYGPEDCRSNVEPLCEFVVQSGPEIRVSEGGLRLHQLPDGLPSDAPELILALLLDLSRLEPFVISVHGGHRIVPGKHGEQGNFVLMPSSDVALSQWFPGQMAKIFAQVIAATGNSSSVIVASGAATSFTVSPARYGGDPNLQALLQWAACSKAGKKMFMWHPLGESGTAAELATCAKLLRKNATTVGHLMSVAFDLDQPDQGGTIFPQVVGRLVPSLPCAAPPVHETIQKYAASTVEQLEQIIQLSRCTRIVEFSSLRTALSIVGKDDFFSATLPLLRDAALRWDPSRKLPYLLPNGAVNSLALKEREVYYLLANAFFCTFPNRLSDNCRSRSYDDMPSINLDELFSSGGAPSVKANKLAMILEYFKTMAKRTAYLEQDPSQERSIRITRGAIDPEQINWNDSTHPLCPVVVHNLGESLDDAEGMLKVDFANKCIGGGAISYGCVQEEIMFVHSPELIVSRLVCPEMRNNEAILISGVCRFCRHTGYAFSLRCGSRIEPDYKNTSHIVALDALDLRYGYPDSQFEPHNIHRELNKAFAGFSLEADSTPTDVATGNWGCGAFLGNPQLKALLQWAACSEAGKRSMHYYPFDDKALATEFAPLVQALRQSSATVGDLIQELVHNARELRRGSSAFEVLHRRWK
eukprot:TRINITY_DN7748_c0_g1_i1.p1 TRINITY_DN7748_c0_g1~~TRINITY_DN7748_c0_g1_i1.p1  ORF type:complete len:782 (+),score=101.45 TRINITY_DN7748_c0_g1_i1:22-2346(+)